MNAAPTPYVPDARDWSGAFAAGQAAAQQQRALQEQEAARQAAIMEAESQQRYAAWKQAVGRAMLEGRCDEARNMLLGAGEIETAGSVDRLCRPRATATPNN